MFILRFLFFWLFLEIAANDASGYKAAGVLPIRFESGQAWALVGTEGRQSGNIELNALGGKREPFDPDVAFTAARECGTDF